MCYKGIVLKIKKTYALVLTENCEYKRIKIKGSMHIGQKIMFTNQDLIKQKEIRKEEWNMSRKIIAAALAVCAVLTIFVVISFINVDKASALVSLDINPSVDIKVSEDNTVLEIIHLNNEAELITDNDMIGKNIIEVLNEMILKAEELGFLNEFNNNILISAAPLNDKSSNDIDDAIKNYLTNDAQFSAGVEVIYISSTKETAEHALDDGISLGKLEVSNMSDHDFDDDTSVGEMMDDDDIRILLLNNIIIHGDEDIIEDIYEVLEELQMYSDSNQEAADMIAAIEAAIANHSNNLEELLENAEDWLDDMDDDDDDDDEQELLDELFEAIAELEEYAETNEEAAQFIIYAQAALLDENTDLEELLHEAEELLDKIEDDEDDEVMDELLEALEDLKEYADSDEEIAEFIEYAEQALLDETTDLEALLEEAEDLLDEMDDESDDDDEHDDDDDEHDDDEHDDDEHDDDEYDDDEHDDD